MNKTRKGLILALLLISITLISVFSLTANAAVSGPSDGMTFAKDVYYLQEQTPELNGNFTIEADVWMDPTVTYGSNKAYVILGSYADSKGDGFNLLVRSPSTSTEHKNKLFVELYDRRIVNGSNKNTTMQFTGIDLKNCFGTESNPTYCNILISVDVSAKSATLYLTYKNESGVDTTYTETITPKTWNANAYTTSTFPFIVGGDHRTGNSAFFVGKTKSLAMYNGISFNAGTVNGIDPMFKYDLTDTSVDGLLADLSGNSNDAKNPNVYDDSLGYDYSFAIVGDTQYMTRWDVAKVNGEVSTSEHLKTVYDWILENKNKKNIRYVMGLGDITDSYNKSYATHNSDTAAEWAWAYSQISRLGGQIPYSVVRGNHDNEEYFDRYFVNDAYMNQFKDTDGYGCFYDEGSARNAYTKFEVGTEKYLLLLLDDNPTDPVLEWANEVVRRNPDYRVIINTHTYLAFTGDLVDDSATYSYATKNLYEGENNGVQMWEKLVSKHENIFLVLCGHDNKNGGDIIRTIRIGDHGNAVNEFIVNGQALDGDEVRETKAGMVAMLYFSNGGKDVRVEYVSTAKTYAEGNGKDVYQKPEVNNRAYNLMTLPTETKHGYIYPEYLDVDKYPIAVFSGTGIFLGAYDSIFDITNPYNDSGAIYKAKTTLDVNSWSGEKFNNDPVSATIVLRKDYALKSNESYNNTSFIKGVVTIDLNGFVLTANESRSPFSATIKPLNSTTTIPTEIDFINGIVELSSKPFALLTASGGSNNLDISKKPFVLGFKNIEFRASESATSILLSYTADVAANPEVFFNNCTFDMTAAPNGALVFDLGNGAVNSTVTVRGGRLITNASSDFVLYDNAKTDASLVFDKDESENYIEFAVPKGLTLPALNINGGALDIVKSSEGETYDIYKLTAPKLEVASMFSLTLYTDFVYNVYVPVKDYVTSITLGTTVYNDLSKLATKEIGGVAYYHLTMKVGVTEAGSGIALAVTTTADTQSWTVSVIAYASAIISGDNSSDEKTLASDILSYVRAAYAYAKINDGTAEKINAIIGTDYDASNKATIPAAKAETAGLASARFMLSETPYLVFYPELDGNGKPVYDLDSYVFSLDGKYLLESYVTEIEGKTAFVVKTYAFAADNDIVYFIDGTSISGTYNVGAYYKFATELADAELITLIERLIRYAESAESYRAKF